MLTLEQIAQRASREARGDNRVLIGSGLAAKVRPYLPKRVKVVPGGNGARSVDVAFYSLEEIADREAPAHRPRAGNKPSNDGLNERSVTARRTVVLVAGSPDRKADISRLGRLSEELDKDHMELRVITDLAVLDLTADGITIREVAPGVSAREVQQATGAALLAGPDLCEIEVDKST